MTIQTHPWHHEQHHTARGFRNIWGTAQQPSFFKVLRWLLRRALKQRNHVLPPVRPLDPASLATPPERLRITWIGHATMLVQTPDTTILTDPVFSQRASPLSFLGPARKTPPALSLDDLPPIDYVLLSHDHYDHLDANTIPRLAQQHDPVFLTPLGVDAIVQKWGARQTQALDWWQYLDLGGWRFHCTPAMHFSGRGLLNRNHTLWAGWYLENRAHDLAVYFAGDSGYADLFGDIRERLGAPEVALLPIGAYAPRWFMEAVHMDPAQALQAFLDLEAQHFIPTHWGTFDLADELLQEPPALIQHVAQEHNVADCLHLLDIGGQFSLDARLAPVPRQHP
jgi:L-ascorbate metabolism protein UlaG (beta-lactamase superfamily)